MKVRMRTDSEAMLTLSQIGETPDGSCCHLEHEHDDGTKCYVVSGLLTESLAEDVSGVEVVA